VTDKNKGRFELLEQARVQLADPHTSGAQLQAIATEYRDLWNEVARHPNAYPDLLNWLDSVGDSQVRATVARRRAASGEPAGGPMTGDPTVLAPAVGETGREPTVLAPGFVAPQQGFAEPMAYPQGQQAAVSGRLGSQIQPSAYTPYPATMPSGDGQPRNNTGLMIGIIAAVVALIVAVVVVFVVKPGSNSSDEPSSSLTTSSSTSEGIKTASPPAITLTDPPVDGVMQPLVLPSIPSLPINPITVNSNGTSPNLQKLVADIVTGDVDKIASSCWTQPSDEVRLVYGSAAMRGAILQALSQTPMVAQYGAVWTGQYVTVSAIWEELDSNYPCLDVSWADAGGWNWQGLGAFTPSMAKWRMTRALAIHDGTPVHTGDGSHYQVICDSYCSMWNPHNTVETMAPILNASADQWQALRALSRAPIVVEHISSRYFRVWAADGSTTAVAYFNDMTTDFWGAYSLGEIVP